MPSANEPIPASLPPSGAAGGDLTGTYPSPTIGAGKVTATKLADPGTGKVYGSSGSGAAAAVYPPGYELAYAQQTADVSSAATTAATAVDVVTTGSVTYDGTAVMLEFFCSTANGGTNWIIGAWYMDGAVLLAQARYTPAAGAHTFGCRIWVDAGTGTCAATGKVPSFVRVTKV